MNNDAFAVAHAFTAKWEGGLSDVPQDAGGITRYGVSLAFLQGLFEESPATRQLLSRIGVSLPPTRESVKRLTADQAAALFRDQFWDDLKCDAFPLPIAVILYDMAVNHGRSRAVRLAQRGYNATLANASGRLDEDGVPGPLTRRCLSVDSPALRRAILDARENFYRAIVSAKPSQRVFLRGWLNRTNDLRAYVEKL